MSGDFPVFRGSALRLGLGPKLKTLPGIASEPSRALQVGGSLQVLLSLNICVNKYRKMASLLSVQSDTGCPCVMPQKYRPHILSGCLKNIIQGLDRRPFSS